MELIEFPDEMLVNIINFIPKVYQKFFVKLVCKRFNIIVGEIKLDLKITEEIIFYLPFKFFVNFNFPQTFHKNIIGYACLYGRFDIFICILSKIEINSQLLINACIQSSYGGSLKILKWLQKNYNVVTSEYLLNVISFSAAKGRKIKILKWLKKEGFTFTTKTFCGASLGGDIKTLKWLINEKCPYDSKSCEAAVWSENILTLEWLRSLNPPCPWSLECYETAMRTKNEKMIHWLLSQNPPLIFNCSPLGVTDQNLRMSD